MPVVSVREVRMRVDQRFVPMPMAMFGAGRHRIVMPMLVVFVVGMFVTVFHLFVLVSVLVALSKMQPRAQRHQCTGHQQGHGDRLPHQYREQGAEERRDRKISPGARRAKVAQAYDE